MGKFLKIGIWFCLLLFCVLPAFALDSKEQPGLKQAKAKSKTSVEAAKKTKRKGKQAKNYYYQYRLIFALEYQFGLGYGGRIFFNGRNIGLYFAYRGSGSKKGSVYYEGFTPYIASNLYATSYKDSEFERSEYSVGLTLNFASMWPALRKAEKYFSIGGFLGFSWLKENEYLNYYDPAHSLSPTGFFKIDSGSGKKTYIGAELGVNIILLRYLSLHVAYSTVSEGFNFGIGFCID